MSTHTIRKAIFPGAFDPFTIGHENIVIRGLDLFDEIVVAVGINSEKNCLFTIPERLEHIRRVFADHENVSVDTYSGLTVDFAKEVGASHILRGIRTSADFEYERAIAQVNKQMSGIDTAFLLTTPEHTPVNSTIVRDILRHNGDASMFLPEKLRSIIK
ncbi:MAG: pantetheine-phosphate adenylyltransferase [Bacteroidales bacterium]|nr:pantetheine-phosphate adenylyltransferase [Bacteroidales bacterium]